MHVDMYVQVHAINYVYMQYVPVLKSNIIKKRLFRKSWKKNAKAETGDIKEFESTKTHREIKTMPVCASHLSL